MPASIDAYYDTVLIFNNQAYTCRCTLGREYNSPYSACKSKSDDIFMCNSVIDGIPSVPVPVLVAHDRMYYLSAQVAYTDL